MVLASNDHISNEQKDNRDNGIHITYCCKFSILKHPSSHSSSVQMKKYLKRDGNRISCSGSVL